MEEYFSAARHESVWAFLGDRDSHDSARATMGFARIANQTGLRREMRPALTQRFIGRDR